ncbi:hypothetical protein [Kineobactrum salinum]|nr:hypothetical protein [Kineobactrum salinum]
MYVETATSDALPPAPGEWQLYRDKTAGAVNYRLYRYQP